MKLYETIPALKDPKTRRMIVLRAAASAAALEGMEESAKKNLAEVEEIRRAIESSISAAGAKGIA